MATFNGGSNDDIYVGTADPDQANGNGGNDNLYGLGGNDTLDGGEGNDGLEGGENDDKLIGGAGVDTLNGGNGGDTLYSHSADPLFGGYHTSPGVSYDVTAEADTLTGGAGNDYLFAGFGDTVDGGTDDFTGDRLYISFQGASSGVSADFRLLANGPVAIGSGTISNVEYVDYIEGSNFDDLLASYGSYYPYATRIYGRGGDDHIITHYYAGFAGGGAWGGDGNDTIDASASGYGPSLYGEAGDDILTGGSGGRLEGGEGNDTLKGSYSWDSLYGGTGNDVIDAGGSQDWVFGEDGNDILYGGGNDDDIDGGAGDDLIYGDFSPNGTYDSYSPASRADRIKGGTGNDTIHGDDGNDQIDGGADADKLYGGAGDDSLTGGAGNDRLEGGEGSDTFYGGDGVDTIVAGTGNDTLSGEAGGDILFVGGDLTSADLVLGGLDVDTMVIQGNYAGGLTLTANVNGIENISILAGSNTNFGEPGTNRYDYVLTTHDSNFAAGVQARINGAALLEGEDFTFNGTAETNASFVVYGGKGKDTLTGGLGNDIFFYAEERFASGDTVNGGAGYDGMFLRGNYTIDFNAPGYTGLFTNIENLTLTSATDERYARGGGTEFDYNLTLSDAIVGAGQQLTVSGALLMATETMVLDASQETDGMLRLFGGAAADTLKGGALADLLHGNLGADVLSGGGGADAFRYQETAESSGAAMDQILDFTPGTDRIELDRIDANTGLGGDQAFAWIGSNAFSGVAGQLRAYEQGGTWFVEGDVNGDSIADLVIALTPQGPTPLGASDFIL